jgi:hypothetical protein
MKRRADERRFARLSLLAKTGVSGEALLAKPDCCVRQNRVGLASVADVKLAEVKSTQPGFDQP